MTAYIVASIQDFISRVQQEPMPADSPLLMVGQLYPANNIGER